MRAFNEMDEGKFIIERAKKWPDSNGSLGDIPILYRSNAHSRVLEQVLRQSQLPYKIYGGLRFFDRAEIKDVLGYLRLLANISADPAFERFVDMPPRWCRRKKRCKQLNCLSTSLKSQIETIEFPINNIRARAAATSNKKMI